MIHRPPRPGEGSAFIRKDFTLHPQKSLKTDNFPLNTPRYIAIAAMASNRVIGKDGALPWHLPEDLKFFRKTTTGHPILMGRKTWESLGRPLPNRRNLILSRTLPSPPGAEILNTLEALDALALEGPVYIIGGAEIYQLLLPRTHEIFLTVLTESAEGDTVFPAFETDFILAEVLDEIPGKAEWRRYVRA